jgi:lipopolysaccharide assembly protein A
MTALTWVVRLIIFAFLVVFAIQNTTPVALTVLFGYQWQAPLVILLLAFFAGGAVLGVLSLLGLVFTQRREISRLKRAVGKADHDAGTLIPPPLP